MPRKIYWTNGDYAHAKKSINDQVKAIYDKMNGTHLHGEEIMRFNIAVQIPSSCNKRAKIVFSANAMEKINALVRGFESEVQWHGLVERHGDEEFYINDILIFPHEAREATVTSDPKEYMDWMDSLPDEDFVRVRFHGHSHVNMGTSPSWVDDEYRKNIVKNFGTPSEGDDFFYLFGIFNKRGESNFEIFDVKNNLHFSSQEIDVDVEVKGENISTFLQMAKAIVKVKTPKQPLAYQEEDTDYACLYKSYQEWAEDNNIKDIYGGD